jgi:hypothetical protein
MDIRGNLDFLEYRFNPVFQAFEEVCDVEKIRLMYDKNTTNNVKQRTNNSARRWGVLLTKEDPK